MSHFRHISIKNSTLKQVFGLQKHPDDNINGSVSRKGENALKLLNISAQDS